MEEKKFFKDSSAQNVIIESRERVSISGVENVESFDEEKIIMETTEGMLTIEGENLHINSLSLEEGEMMVEGYVFSVVYSDGATSASGGIFSKLFR